MMKKIAINAIVFLGCAFVFIVMFFPYGKVIDFYAVKAAKAANINFHADSTEGGPFSAVFSGIRVNDFQARQLKLSYTPFSAITKSISAVITSDMLNGEADYSGGEVETKMMVSLGSIPEAADFGVKGDVVLNGVYSLEKSRGSGTISSASLTIPTDMGPITLENLSGELSADDNTLNIKNLKSEGLTSVNMGGNIRLNKRDIQKSTVSLKGKITVAGMEKNIAIRGSVSQPKVTVN